MQKNERDDTIVAFLADEEQSEEWKVKIIRDGPCTLQNQVSN